MSETAPEREGPAPAEDGAEAGEGTLSDRMDRLEALVERFIEGTTNKPEPEAPDIKAEVRAAVREVAKSDKDKADKAAEQQSIQDQLAELKAAVEKPPQEYRRVTEKMGWARP